MRYHQSDVMHGTAIALLSQAAKLSEGLHAKARPISDAAWDLDSKAAMIRRHQNGPAPSAYINGTPEEHEALRRSMIDAENVLSGRAEREVVLGDGITLEVIAQAARLLAEARDIIREAAQIVARDFHMSPPLRRWDEDVTRFAEMALMTRDMLGGEARRVQAIKLLEDDMSTLLPGVLAEALGETLAH